MSGPAVVVEDLWKSFRLNEEKNQNLNAPVLKGRLSRNKDNWELREIDF